MAGDIRFSPAPQTDSIIYYQYMFIEVSRSETRMDPFVDRWSRLGSGKDGGEDGGCKLCFKETKAGASTAHETTTNLLNF